MSVIAVVGIVVVHLLGILLYMLNSCYMRLTRWSGGEGLDRPSRKRCCKLRNIKAMNFLTMHHAGLVILDFIISFLFLSQDEEDRGLSITPTMIWILPGTSYMFLFIGMPIAMACGMIHKAHVGPLHAFNIFEFLHLIIFWASLFYMIICAGIDTSEMHEDFRNLAHGYAAIPMAWAYLMMVIGPCMNKGFFKLGKDVISRQQAVNFINGKIQETPSIKWKVSCGYTIQRTKHRSKSF